MKNKILVVGALVMTLAFASNVYAMAQNSNRNSGTVAGNQVQQQTQAINQDDGANQSENGAGAQIQQQTRQKLQDGSELGDQVQNQNQVKNQGEDNQIKNENKSGTAVVEQRRSNVANAVQEMLLVAERDAGIGQQLKTIAQAQNQNQEKLEAGLQKVQSRSNFATFFIGPNYGEINRAQKLIEQNREQINQLNQIKNQLSDQADAQNLNQQIQTLEQANLQIENSFQNTQKGFSLFGWMFKLFSK
jgi:hypothetical protein